MAELKIAEVILRERRRLNLTQEELAIALMVSPQAVSNWERGGYPDITLLPRIANFFKISVDELIGNDEVNRQADIEAFIEKFNHSDVEEQLVLAKKYYQKYPSDFCVAECLAIAIQRNKDCWESDYPLLKEICSKIIAECTWEYTRQNAIECMSIVCPDEEWENWQYKGELFYSSCQNERIEERLWQRKRFDEYQKQSAANNLLSLMHFLGREYMRYYEKDNAMLFQNPQRTAALMQYRMRILENISEDGSIPEAWRGCYADCCLKAAGALIGVGKTEEGFSYLERTFVLYERWLKIPEGQMMSVGNFALFGNTRISKVAKKYEIYIHFEDGSTVWCPYLWLFWQIWNDIERAMSNWPWFDHVREDARFLSAYKKAQEMANSKS